MLYYPYIDWRYEENNLFEKSFNRLIEFLYQKPNKRVKKLIDNLYTHIFNKIPIKMDIPVDYKDFKYFSINFYLDSNAGDYYKLEAGFKYNQNDIRNKCINLSNIKDHLKYKDDFCWDFI